MYENRALAFGSQAKDDNEHNLTLSALKWLTETGASLVMLDRLGKVRVVTGPTSPSEARPRRAQAMAIANGTAAGIGRELISAKLAGHQTLVRREIETLGYSVKIGLLSTTTLARKQFPAFEVVGLNVVPF